MRDREQLVKTTDRRLRHLMIQSLESFEQYFPHLQEQKSGQVYKANLRTMFNDVIRAQRDELNDYQVEYKPARSSDNILYLTKTFLESIQKVDFTNKPSVKFYANLDRLKVLDSLRVELGVGVIYYLDDNRVVLEIVGLESCVNCVLPLLDKYKLYSGIRLKYQNWRKYIVDLYRS